jgi:hypothetical protein
MRQAKREREGLKRKRESQLVMRHRFVTRAEKEAETERERRRKKEVFSTLPVLYLQSIIIHAVAFRPPIISSNLSSRPSIYLH